MTWKLGVYVYREQDNRNVSSAIENTIIMYVARCTVTKQLYQEKTLPDHGNGYQEDNYFTKCP
jgi:hypothetical protein